MTLGLIAKLNWTPRQIVEDVTIPQMVALWLWDSAQGWTECTDEAAALKLIRERRAKREAAKRGNAG